MKEGGGDGKKYHEKGGGKGEVNMREKGGRSGRSQSVGGGGGQDQAREKGRRDRLPFFRNFDVRVPSWMKVGE